MEQEIYCKEFFLDGVTDVSVYPSTGNTIPVPFCVPRILSLTKCKFADPLLHITTGTDGDLTATHVTIKQTQRETESGTVFSFDITAEISEGGENLPELLSNIHENDHLVVITHADGTHSLCYTLPGTFSISVASSHTESSVQLPITINTQAMSDYIPIGGD